MEQEAEECRRVLVIENDNADADTLMKYLSELSDRKMEVAHVNCLEEALGRVSQDGFDLVLMNLDLPDSGGLYTLKRFTSRFSEVPIIIVNGPNDDLMAQEAIVLGAQDYLRRGTIGINSLASSIHNAWIRFSAHRGKIKKLESQAQSSKISALAGVAQDVVLETSMPLKVIREKIQEIRDLTEAKEELSPRVVREVLLEMENASSEFSSYVNELKTYWRQVAEDPLVRARKKGDFRVLCVDDEPEILEIMSDMLKSDGFESVVCASNGQDAFMRCLEALRDGTRIDFIVSDWKMPKMNGLVLLDRVRGHSYLKNTPFMMVTAVDEKDDIRRAANLKVTDYLMKPFEKVDFLRRVNRMRHQVI